MELTEQNLAQLVKGTRISLGLTQAQLAKRAGCSQRLVSDLESGKNLPGFDKVMRIFEALQLRLVLEGARMANPAAEVEKLVAVVSADPVPAKARRLADYL